MINAIWIEKQGKVYEISLKSKQSMEGTKFSSMFLNVTLEIELMFHRDVPMDLNEWK